MNYSYYPGCSATSSSIDYEISVQEVCSFLGLSLAELEDWNCCGSTHLSSVTPEISVALSVRNLGQAAGELITPCSVCYANLKLANRKFCEDSKVSKQVNDVVKNNYNGDTKIRHLIEVFVQDLGLEALKSRVTKPLSSIKVAPYYGCLLTRPIADFDDAENPQCLDNLITSVGAEVVPYFYKTKCCGGPIFVAQGDAALEATRDILLMAKEEKADCICVICPLCHIMLDAMQPDVESMYKTEIGIPIIYFTQLVGLALDLNPQKLGLFKHIVSVNNILDLIV